MKTPVRLLAVALLVLWASTVGAAVIPIGNLHCNDVNGVPLMLGQTVTVQGTVLVPRGVFNPATSFYDGHIQDATGAIDVFIGGGVPAGTFALNDSVEVTGTVTQFNGLTEIGSNVTF